MNPREAASALHQSLRQVVQVIVLSLRASPVLAVIPIALGAFGLWTQSRGEYSYDLVGVGGLAFNACWMPLMGFSQLAPSPTPGGAGLLEFLLTRAIDRRLYLRSATALYLLVASMPVLLQLGVALAIWPELTLRPLHEPDMALYHEAFPDGQPSGPSAPYSASGGIFLPRGRVVAALFGLWEAVLFVMVCEGVMVLLLRKRLNPQLIWVVPFSAMGLLWIDISHGTHERLAIRFAAHPLPFVLGLLTLAVAAHLVYEREFLEIEVG